MGTLTKDGYRSEKRDSFHKAMMAILAIIFGVGVVVLAVSLYATLSGCGGGGSDSVYNGNGECVKNCSSNGDGYVSSSDNVQPNGDTPLPQPDTELYVCPVKEPPEICILYTDTYCAGFSLDGSLVACGGPEDTTNGQGCGCSMAHSPEQVNCKTDYECQLKPQDAWPPCVCWDFCGFLGEWLCQYPYSTAVRIFSFLPDEGDGLCHFGNSGEGALGKPGDPNPRYPLDGEPEQSYILSPDGQTLTDLVFNITCTKL